MNAAIEGCFRGGATDVVVADGHATMRNVVLDELDERARYVTGPAQARNRPLGQISGLERDRYDAAMLVGHHSRAGTPGGLLSHTWVGALVHEIRLNGRPAGEALLNAAIFAHYRVPVVLATGADEFCREVRADLGEDLEVVEVKQTLGPSAVITLTPKRAQALIRDAAVRAMKSDRAPLRVELPVTLELEFHRGDMRERALELGGDPFDRRGIRYTGSNVIEAVESLWRALAHTLREEAAFLK